MQKRNAHPPISNSIHITGRQQEYQGEEHHNWNIAWCSIGTQSVEKKLDAQLFVLPFVRQTQDKKSSWFSACFFQFYRLCEGNVGSWLRLWEQPVSAEHLVGWLQSGFMKFLFLACYVY